MDWAAPWKWGWGEGGGQDHAQAEISVTGQGVLKVGGAADITREVGLAVVCEHTLEMEMSDGGFQEQSFPSTGWGEVSPLLPISQHGHAPTGGVPEKRGEGRTLGKGSTWG